MTLTIDNSDGELPIDYTEVTISRTMFRSGGSEYAINGQPCRLLDVQELLSDSGIGREMHVIVGQGQLDSVLSAGPEERRGFIEEAAGVLKHRKRKEKALRKLEAMQANLTRVQDLTAELRRQLKPLGRQAEVARRASVIQSDLRDARLRLLADDLVQMTSTLEAEVADETALRERRAEVERALAEVQQRETDLEQETAAEAPALARAQETWYRLSSLRERFRGTGGLAAERVRHLAEEAEEQRSGPRPRRARGAGAPGPRRGARDPRGGRARPRGARPSRSPPGRRPRPPSSRSSAASRPRPGLPPTAARGWPGWPARSPPVAARWRPARPRSAGSLRRWRRPRPGRSGPRASSPRWRPRWPGWTPASTASTPSTCRRPTGWRRPRTGSPTLRAEERDAERERATQVARKEALELGLARKDGAGTVLAATDRLGGVLGSVAALLSVQSGYETAIAAALGAAADAVAVVDVGSAVDAIRLLKDDDAGRAGLLVGSPSTPYDEARATHRHPARGPPRARPGDRSRRAAPHRGAPARRDGRGRRAAGGARGRRGGTRAASRSPATATSWRADRAAGGSATAPSLIEVQAAVDEADARLAEAGHRLDRLRFALQTAVEEQRRGRARRRRRAGAAAPVRRPAGRGRRAARPARRAGPRRRGEAERVQRSIEAASAQLAADREAVAELEARLAAAEQSTDDDEPDEPDTTVRDELAPALRRRPGRPRWRPGWPCARVRSARGRSAGARRHSTAAPRRSGRPGPGRSRAGSGGPARRSSPRPWPPPRRRCSATSRARWPSPPRRASRPRPRAPAGTRSGPRRAPAPAS